MVERAHRQAECVRVGQDDARSQAIDDDLLTGQRTTSPLGGEVTKHRIFNIVPFAGAWREYLSGLMIVRDTQHFNTV